MARTHTHIVRFRTFAPAGLLAIVLLLLGSPVQARAYADPGTGAFIYQAVYAAVIGATFYLRRLLNRIRGRRK